MGNEPGPSHDESIIEEDSTKKRPPKQKFWTKTSQLQLLFAVIVNLTAVAVGLTFSFATTITNQLKQPGSNINLTNNEESWIASVVNLAVPFGCVLSGYIMDKLGRKMTLMICNIPYIIGWIIIGTASRIICGIAVGLTLPVPRVYTSEIALPSMRGTIGVIANLALSVGATMMATMGTLTYWYTAAFLCAGYSFVLFLINYFIIPETHTYLLMKGNTEKAFKSLQRVRSKTYNVRKEMDNLIEGTVYDTHRLSFTETVEHLFERKNCIPFRIIMVYFILGQLSGMSVLMFWTHDVVERSKTEVAPLSILLLSNIRIVSSIFGSFLMFKLGRRTVSIISGIGICLSSLNIGTYLQLTDKKGIFTLVFLVLDMFSYVLGFQAIPFLLVSEMFPQKIRGLMSGITVSLANILIFISIKLYAKIRFMIDFGNLMYIFSFMAFLGVVYLILCLPETKNLTLIEIEEYFSKSPRWILPRQEIFKNFPRNVKNFLLVNQDNANKLIEDKK